LAKVASTPTRVAADVAATAAGVAALENRSVAEQISHWVRLGMQVERSASASSRQVVAVVSGQEQFSTLSAADRIVAHATIDARIAERAAAEQFGDAARRAGRVTVSIDDDGNLIEIAADGASVASLPEREGTTSATDLWRLVEELPPRERAAVSLRYRAGLPQREIAVVLGIAPGAVATALARARKKLSVLSQDLGVDLPLAEPLPLEAGGTRRRR
jgi:RNA polymerase sigma factor (sigma-70 family)